MRLIGTILLTVGLLFLLAGGGIYIYWDLSVRWAEAHLAAFEPKTTATSTPTRNLYPHNQYLPYSRDGQNYFFNIRQEPVPEALTNELIKARATKKEVSPCAWLEMLIGGVCTAGGLVIRALERLA